MVFVITKKHLISRCFVPGVKKYGESAIARSIRAVPSATAIPLCILAITRDTALAVCELAAALPCRGANLRKMRASLFRFAQCVWRRSSCAHGSPGTKKSTSFRGASFLFKKGESASPCKVSLGETARQGFELPCHFALLVSVAILLHGSPGTKKSTSFRGASFLFKKGESAIARLFRAVPSATAIPLCILAITRDTALAVCELAAALPCRGANLRKMRASLFRFAQCVWRRSSCAHGSPGTKKSTSFRGASFLVTRGRIELPFQP